MCEEVVKKEVIEWEKKYWFEEGKKIIMEVFVIKKEMSLNDIKRNLFFSKIQVKD